MKTLVIAEMGSCHDGSLEKARRLIEVAKDCGADAVKGQYWSSAGRMSQRRRAPEYLDIYERYRVPADWLPVLKTHADACGIQWMCTSYLPEDVWRVAEYSDTLKIASFEANDREHLVAHVAPVNAGKRVLISLGMGARVDMVNEWLVRGVTERSRIAVHFLHCVSSYPTPVEQLGLNQLRFVDWTRGDSVQRTGFSDHSEADHTWTGALAVAAGAFIVERHFRDEHGDSSNPDFPHAMNPRAFREYVRHIRFAETCLGDEGAPSIQPCESAMAKYRVTA